ncbi:hypothetical protein ACFE04_025890 [Oxalis oulophora]
MGWRAISSSFLILPPPSPFLSHHHVHCIRIYSYKDQNTLRFIASATIGRTECFKSNQNDDAFDNFEDYDDDGHFTINSRRRRRRRRWMWSDDDWETMNRKSSSSSSSSSGGGGLEEVIDSIWILKVFKSYGWLLPFIIISFLLNSGPKAFLMAFSLPFGFSLLLLAYDNLSGKTLGRRERNRNRRRKPFVGFGKTEEQEDIGGAENENTRRYQSWMDADDDSFGGWDELQGTKSTTTAFRTKKGSKRRSVGNNKSSMMDQSDTPLLLRLLVALFPFLNPLLD